MASTIGSLTIFFALMWFCSLIIDAAPVRQRNNVTLGSNNIASAGLGQPAIYFQSLFTSSNGVDIETSITVGSQTLSVIVGTSSSVTWVASTSTQCLESPNGPVLTQDICNFGPVYNPELSATKIEIDNSTSEISYPDGSVVRGRFVFEQVFSAGITLLQQEVLIADSVYLAGDLSCAGMLGLGPPNYLLEINGNDGMDAINGLAFPPNTSLLTSMFVNGGIPPTFGVAINKSAPNASAGFLSFGGLPPVSLAEDISVIDTPLVPTSIVVSSTNNAAQQSSSPIPVYSAYTIMLDNILYEDQHATLIPLPEVESTSPILVDILAGARYSHLPSNIVRAINGLYNPVANYSSPFNSTYPISCTNTTPPPILALQLPNTKTLPLLNPSSLILQTEIDLHSALLRFLNLDIDDRSLLSLVSDLEKIDTTLGHDFYLTALGGVKASFANHTTGSVASQNLEDTFDFLGNIQPGVLGDLANGVMCTTAFVDADGDAETRGQYILGDAFLENVVVAVDVKNGVVRMVPI